jgi:hypothetical protein
MKILLKIKREGGSKIDIDKITYHFKPNEKGHHVAEVKDAAHIKRFLSINGYHAYEGEEPEDEPETPVVTANTDVDENLDLVDDDETVDDEDDDQALLGSSTLPGIIVIAEGVEMQLGDIVGKAFEVSGLTTDEWNALTDEERDELLNEQITIQKSLAEDKAKSAANTTANTGKAQGDDSNTAAPANTGAGTSEDTRTPAQKRKDTLAAKAAAGGNSKPASAKPKANPALAKK